jgi:hypothetical protein
MENGNEGFRPRDTNDDLCAEFDRDAESACHSQAIGKNGKPLAGAALNSFMTKCTREACEPKAIGKDGRPLAGAAKASFMKKCQTEA